MLSLPGFFCALTIAQPGSDSADPCCDDTSARFTSSLLSHGLIRWKIQRTGLEIKFPFTRWQPRIYFADPAFPVKVFIGGFMAPQGIDIDNARTRHPVRRKPRSSPCRADSGSGHGCQKYPASSCRQRSRSNRPNTKTQSTGSWASAIGGQGQTMSGWIMDRKRSGFLVFQPVVSRSTIS